MMLRQGTRKKERFHVTPSVVTSNTGLENQYLLPVDSAQAGSDLSGHSQQLLHQLNSLTLNQCELEKPRHTCQLIL